MLTRRKILTVSAVVAVVARAAFGFTVWGSPYRYFHLVPGLDMQTLWNFAAPGAAPTLLVAPRLLFQLVRVGGGGVFSLFIIQALGGALGAVLCADLARYFTRDRLSSLTAGVIYALYAPFLLYEFTVLQEAVLINLILAAIWIFLWAYRRRYSVGAAALAAAVLAFAALGRPVALPLGVALGLALWWRGPVRAAAAFGASFAAVLLTAMLFNHFFSDTWSPFFQVWGYVVATNAGADAAPGVGSWLTTIGRAITRLPELFSARSLAENLNIYFLERQLPVLGRLLRPEGVIPLGIAGWVLMAASPRFRLRAGVLLAIILLLAVPISFRPAMERYQLLLVPYLIIAGAFVISFFRRRPAWPELLGGTGVIGSVFLVAFLLSPRPTLRADDFLAWGLAAESGGFARESEAAYRADWEIFHDPRAALHILRQLSDQKRLAEAAALCREVLQVYPENEKFSLYLAGFLLSAGKVADARAVLTKLPEPQDSELQKHYRVLRGLAGE